MGKYEVVVLCGSTKFKDEFLAEQKRLTLEGNIVISVGLFGHADGEFENGTITPEVKQMLDEIHLQKIDMANRVHVINKGGYVGESTLREISYAMTLRKKITYME